MTVKVELLTHETNQQVQDLLRYYVTQEISTGFGKFAIDEDVVKETFQDAVDSDKQFVYVTLRDGRVTGMLWLQATQTFWSNDYYLSDVVFYVHKDYRNKREALLLIQTAERVARELNVKLLQLAGLNGTGGINNVYRRRGYTEIGSVFHLNGGSNGQLS